MAITVFLKITDLNFLSKIRNILAMIGAICFLLLMLIDYNQNFIATVFLPLFFILSVWIFVDKKFIGFGVGSLSLVMFYCVRMCIFPVILAYGDFYFEPSESLYIKYYLSSILLMGLENLIVFGTARHWILKYSRNSTEKTKGVKKHYKVLYFTIIAITIITFATFFLRGIDYYHFIAEETIAKFVADENKVNAQSGFFWYLSDYLSGLWRILVSVYAIIIFYRRHPHKILSIVLIVALANMLFLSDRRVFALIVSTFCLIYYLRYFSSQKSRKIIIICIVSLIAVMAYYFGFAYAEQGGAAMIARSVQRYFSGPSLSAFALRINSEINVVPGEFFRLLYNDFQSLVGFFGRIQIHDYVEPYFPSRGIWTPFVPGALRYFGILFPIPLIFCSWCVIKWDCLSRKSQDYLYSMIYSYISFSIAFYLIMYSIELIFYFIIANGLVLNALISIDRSNSRKKANVESSL